MHERAGEQTGDDGVGAEKALGKAASGCVLRGRRWPLGGVSGWRRAVGGAVVVSQLSRMPFRRVGDLAGGMNAPCTCMYPGGVTSCCKAIVPITVASAHCSEGRCRTILRWAVGLERQVQSVWAGFRADVLAGQHCPGQTPKRITAQRKPADQTWCEPRFPVVRPALLCLQQNLVLSQINSVGDPPHTHTQYSVQHLWHHLRPPHWFSLVHTVAGSPQMPLEHFKNKNADALMRDHEMWFLIK